MQNNDSKDNNPEESIQKEETLDNQLSIFDCEQLKSESKKLDLQSNKKQKKTGNS